MGLFNFFKKKNVKDSIDVSLEYNNDPISFKDDKGNVITKEELSKSTGRFSYEITGIDEASDLSKKLHDEARQYGQSGEYDKAIKKLKLANEESPLWPYPLYDLAYTYLLQDDYDNALKYYKLTDELAPRGFFTSKTAVYTLENERTGKFEKGFYNNYIKLEWVTDQDQKNEFIEILISKFPEFPPLWKDYSSRLEGQERIQALEKGLKLNPDVETKGMLLINKALAIDYINKDTKGAIKILTEVIFDEEATYGSIELAKFVLNSISNK